LKILRGGEARRGKLVGDRIQFAPQELQTLADAGELATEVIERCAAKVDGIKIFLLDKDKEIAMRRRLPSVVRMYTGVDCNFAELILCLLYTSDAADALLCVDLGGGR